MHIIFKLLLTINATSLLFITFIVKKGYSPSRCLSRLGASEFTNIWLNVADYIFYASVLLIFAKLIIFLSKYLDKDEFKPGDVTSIENVNFNFLPSYLGYFFVALSIDDWGTFVFVFIMVLIFTFSSQGPYFNPIFLIKYDFYYVTTKNNVKIFLISCTKYRKPDDVVIKQAFRINDYTFIERD